jgi:hypothetical protein
MWSLGRLDHSCSTEDEINSTTRTGLVMTLLQSMYIAHASVLRPQYLYSLHEPRSNFGTQGSDACIQSCQSQSDYNKASIITMASILRCLSTTIRDCSKYSIRPKVTIVNAMMRNTTPLACIGTRLQQEAIKNWTERPTIIYCSTVFGQASLDFDYSS